ncbi:polyribonucleotide nucleotidyltransferase [Alphaproteobacteria bacterium]|nr:polyribonucleotide nucleotidyltransferase [Alphaproteobacteria bacterium]GHS97429.1 polyribonucleotide nucleotidyltransferase [Alphaproteobacteria bacterium]
MTDSFFKVYKEEFDLAGRAFSLETGHIARQANGAVVARYGDTAVLCTVVAAKEAAPEADFFPLTVHYQEKMYAAGRVPGGFFKRENKPSEAETLISRLIDRPLRPLFPENFHNEVQIICTVLAYDQDNSPDIVALVGASAALALSGLPVKELVCAARVGFVNGQFVLNPTPEVLASSQLDLVVAGTESGVLMVESEAQQLPEATMLDAVKFGHGSFAPVLKAIKSLQKKAGSPVWDLPPEEADYARIKKALQKSSEKAIRKALAMREKLERYDALGNVLKLELEKLGPDSDAQTRSLTKRAFEDLEYEFMRADVLGKGHRVDGRTLDEVRPIQCEVGVLPRVHGSALFTRGETQALVVTTLGSGDDEQMTDSLTGGRKETFLMHYNFPPYAVGETGRMAAPGRREIGHGRLAWRALHPLIPAKEAFPYTVRLVSEITESNGSSSMASVCGGSLALMDAGVPLAKPVAGIAMGLVKEVDKFAVLTDIQGTEDHLGDMDFKVAGTADGITALQMDIKITSITFEIMEIALEQARKGRQHIAEQMSQALTEARKTLNKFAPQIVGIQIDKDKIRELIGPGGKVIREICDATGAKIDISDDGEVAVFGQDQASLDEAVRRINDIVGEPEVGQIYSGPVVKTTDFGAFVNFYGSRDGLVHISEISTERIENVEDVLHVGDIVKVVFLGSDPRTKKSRLSIRALTHPRAPNASYERKPRSDGDWGDRSNRDDRTPRSGNDRPPFRDRGDRGDRGPRGDRRGGDRPPRRS